MEDLEKHFFSSYKSHLAKEGKEICKEVDSIIGDNDELMVEKTTVAHSGNTQIYIILLHSIS